MKAIRKRKRKPAKRLFGAGPVIVSDPCIQTFLPVTHRTSTPLLWDRCPKGGNERRRKKKKEKDEERSRRKKKAEERRRKKEIEEGRRRKTAPNGEDRD